MFNYFNSIDLCNNTDISMYMNNQLYRDNRSSGSGKDVVRKKYIRVELNEDEYNRFSQIARKEKISLRHLAVTKMLDSSIGLKEYREHQYRLLPSLYGLIDEVDDYDLQNRMKAKVREIIL